ncbi:phosphatidate cytidylyltransferase, mitochondrial [Condylostylus longicornis]|uniref:phosphatidate cytidylyltransferase, mitochondrial n=1 Tax=Condylostylus longicornis TaxID=2530218 RepID=UPI00244DE34E|nr:phosphatidate cytidylyltransferase, mitochondrial [Condylostylus longicornis]
MVFSINTHIHNSLYKINRKKGKMNVYKKIASKFPPQIAYCIAYGSGVKQQLGYENVKKKSKMIDLVFCVRNTEEWHSKNLSLHPNHYSGLKFFGNKFITDFQKNYGANIYCNTLVNLEDLNLQIKYNVISIDNFIDDLCNWTHLYMAGRMHKPVSIVINDGEKKLQQAIQKNLLSALHVSLLLLPKKFSSYDLFYKISELSYKGDFRMIFGENKNKVHNIVSPQLKEFYELYKIPISKISSCVTQIQNNNDDIRKILYEQDKSKISIKEHIKALPNNLKFIVIKNFAKISDKNHKNEILMELENIDDIKNEKTEEIIEIISNNEKTCNKLISKSVDEIVWRSSITQSIKNIPTAGILKSIFYSWKKALKTFN